MREAMERLREALYQPSPRPAAVPEDVTRAAAEAVVALPAGGFGYRMRAVTDDGSVTQKALLPLPDGDTLIGRLIRQYAEAGFRRFVALVNFEGKAVEEHLGGGARWDVDVRCSYDPEPTGSGRTGALVHAMEQDLLPQDRDVVIHNADCHVFGYPGCFPYDLLRTHLAARRKQGALATVAAVDGWPYAYTGMSIAEGRVTGVEMYPFIPVPAHTGITVVTPEALSELRQHHTETKQNFERDMFPRWAEAGQLAAMVIRHDQWIAVDDRKAYRQFCMAVEREEREGRAPRD